MIDGEVFNAHCSARSRTQIRRVRGNGIKRENNCHLPKVYQPGVCRNDLNACGKLFCRQNNDARNAQRRAEKFPCSDLFVSIYPVRYAVLATNTVDFRPNLRLTVPNFFFVGLDKNVFANLVVIQIFYERQRKTSPRKIFGHCTTD